MGVGRVMGVGVQLLKRLGVGGVGVGERLLKHWGWVDGAEEPCWGGLVAAGRPWWEGCDMAYGGTPPSPLLATPTPPLLTGPTAPPTPPCSLLTGLTYCVRRATSFAAFWRAFSASAAWGVGGVSMGVGVARAKAGVGFRSEGRFVWGRGSGVWRWGCSGDGALSGEGPALLCVVCVGRRGCYRSGEVKGESNTGTSHPPPKKSAPPPAFSSSVSSSGSPPPMPPLKQSPSTPPTKPLPLPFPPL